MTRPALRTMGSEAAQSPRPEARTLTRRDLLRGRLFRQRGASDPAGWGAPFPLLRPPGAVRETDFLSGCTRCGDCITACPHAALRPAPARLRAAAGTPILEPASAPCRLCEELPCIAACEAGVLRSDLPAVMGKARVAVHDCLNRLGSPCSVCIEQCPVPGALSWLGGVPNVHEALCTGCGVCEHACPAPSKAVLVIPLSSRPCAPDAREEVTE